MSPEDGVRYTVAAYVQRIDAGRIEALLELFLDDAVLEIVGSARHEGIDAIRALFVRGGQHLSRNTAVPRIRHHLTSHLIELDNDDDARSSCYWLATVGDVGVDHWGRYVDRLRRVEGAWRFASRRIYLDGAVPGGWGSLGGEWNAG